MQFVPIVPTPWLTTLLTKRSMGFALAHLMDDSRYAAYYRAFARLGKFVILDNSAYELPEPLSMDELWNIVLETRPSELVLPDVMKKRHATFDLLQSSLEYLQNVQARKLLPSIMIVPQADNPSDWIDSAWDMLEAAEKAWPNAITIGVPRHTSSYPGGRRALVKQLLRYSQGRFFNIHLLGVGESTLEISKIAAQFGPYIRSFDSARPFVYAMHGIRINHFSNQHYPHRPSNFFTHHLKQKGPERNDAFANINLFDRISQHV